MHIGQAIKMACKSLWTNKLRSFLTMLGIIIGVLTVSLLTTVASGVSDAVVSSIRTQSTLSIIMNTSSMASSMTSATSSSKMDYVTVNKVLKDNQHEETADDYYKYSLIYSANLPIANDMTGIEENNALNAKDFLHFNYITVTDDEYNAMSDEEKFLVDAYRQMNQKLRPSLSQVLAVDSNFPDVYELNILGRFPTANDGMNEMLVDKEFIENYFGKDVSGNDVLGQKISLGVKYYTKIEIDFLTEPNAQTQAMVMGILSTSQNSFKLKVKDLSVDGNKMIVDVEFYTMYKDEQISTALSMALTGQLASENPITITDIYDYSDYKTYEIVGVLLENNDSIISMQPSSSDRKISFSDLLTSVNGGCYILLDDSNLASLGLPKTKENTAGNVEPFTKDDVVISYAYLRFKNEDVISKRINDLMLSFIGSGIIYMQDYMVVSMSSVASIISEVMNILTTMLTVISIISLLVGGIGIMNIMLVAVTERTREIGIRKAIGAKRSSILVQFLVEALFLSLLGGAIGLVLSAIGSLIISSVMGVTIMMPFWVIAMSLGFCTAIGLIFGMFPAVKASRMQPIDALRRE